MSNTGKHSKNHKRFQLLLAAMGVFITSYEFFFAGFNASHHWYQNMVFDLVLAGFWVGILFIMHLTRLSEVEFDSLDREFNRFEKLIKGLADNEKDKKHAEEMAELLVDCTDEIVMANNKGKRRAPNATEVARIEQLFHDKTGDHYAKLTVVEGGVEAEISSEPIDVAPGRSEAHEAARKRGDAARAEKHSTRIPVIDGDVRERRRQAGIKSAETRKRNLAKAARAAKKG